MRTQDDTWTPERVELATTLWKGGLSAAEVAKRLGGVSRSAVLGKMHRAKLMGQGTPARPDKAARPAKMKRATKPRPTPKPRPVLADNGSVLPEAQPPISIPRVGAFEPLPGTTPRPWTERESGQCTWPVGEGLSCCSAVHKKGWCEAHFDLGTQPMKPKQTAREYERRFAA